MKQVEDVGGPSGSPDFGTLLRQYRLEAGLSQEALAERARMSTNGIGALERGYRRTPQRETLALLVRALALDDQQRRAFEAAARGGSSRPRTPAAASDWPGADIWALPLALTSFVGRRKERDDITGLLSEHRLVTITGVGGVGKTRTALQIVTESCDLAGAVCFVGLGSIVDACLVAGAIASALGIQEAPNRPLLDTLVAYLKSKTLLLLLDNCEHVIGQAATVAQTLLAGCPHLRILATSREPLAAAGERAYRLPSLEAGDAVVLFADRAQAVDSHFALTDETAPGIAEICRRLDGIPLAIELAAAHVNVLSLASLAEKLDDRFHILVGGERTALPRQQTMRATIDWSYDLLSPPQQRLFERLWVFVGGCTLAAATIVCASDGVSESDVLDLLSSLVDKSLVVVDLSGSEPRYALLESFRQYASEKLTARDEAAPTARRHAEAYLELAERLQLSWDSEPDLAWAERTREDLDNWRAALHWALVEACDVVLGQRLASALANAWNAFAPLEGRRWVAFALNLSDEHTPPAVIAALNYADCVIANKLAENRRELASSRAALALYEELGDGLGIARAQSHVGRALVHLGRVPEGRRELAAALVRARALGVRKHLAYVLRANGNACVFGGDFEVARSYIAEASAIYTAIGADWLRALALGTDLAECEFYAGNIELALRLASDALPMLRVYDDTAVAETLNNLSGYLVSLARYDAAVERAREALTFAHVRHLDVFVCRALQHLAAVAALRASAREAHARAARVLGFVDAGLRSLGSPRFPANQRECDRVLRVLRETIGADQLARFLAEGAAISQERAISEALSASS